MKRTFYSILFIVSSCSINLTGTFKGDLNNFNDVPDENTSIELINNDDNIPICGNRIKESGEQCDDGNNINGDGCESNCTLSCQLASDCSDGNICNGQENCDLYTFTCTPGAPEADGFVCQTNPRKICIEGECKESICGDGFLDTAGGEFCEPPNQGNCGEDCNLRCTGNADCSNDNNICNGTEFCDTESGKCSRKDVPDDGYVCSDSPRSICLGMNCQESICGDGFVDSGAEVPEECDDSNDITGDGCENDCKFTCKTNADCDDANYCNGEETCDTISHICSAGSPRAAGTSCNDGQYCTLSDACDGSGNCVGSGNPCIDDKWCTINESCDEANDRCSYDISTGSCFIGENCYNDGEKSIENECLACSSGTNYFVPVSNLTSCSSGRGICCNGGCVVPTGSGSRFCCDANDCPQSYCSGDPASCDSFNNQTACRNQLGCNWTDSYCDGGSVDCGDYYSNHSTCPTECGCRLDVHNDFEICWDGQLFDGNDLRYCRELTQGNCEQCDAANCNWVDAHCYGTPYSCSTFISRVSCINHSGCSWHEYTCNNYTCVSN